MFSYTLRFTLRLFWRSKLFSLVVLFGLSIGLGLSILVFDYAAFELSYDKFFGKSSRIYRVHHSRFLNNEQIYRRAVSLPEVGIAMKDYFPEVEQTARLFPVSLNIEPVFTAILKSGERRSFAEPNVYAADSTFTQLFDLGFIAGDPTTALAGLDKTVISRSAALRYFGTTDVIGQVLKGKDGDLTITGVFQDLPSNTHLKFDMLLSWFDMYGDGSRFTYDGFYNYILLREGAGVENVRRRMPAFADAYMSDYHKTRPGVRSEFELQPLTSIHLESQLDGEMQPGGNQTVVRVLILVAVFIIVVAMINHVHLNTSRSLRRLKEVVVRKTIGTSRSQLSFQFFIEALMMNVTAAGIAITIAVVAYPYFNELFSTAINLELLRSLGFWLTLIVFVVFSSLLCGVYPALLLSGIKVREALKGSSIPGERSWIQRALVTGQFAISLILIVATYALYTQVGYMQSHDLGFEIRKKLVVKLLPSYGEESDTTFIRKMASIKAQLLDHALCDASTISSSIPGRKNEWRGTTRLVGADDDAVIRANLTRVDELFIETFRLKLVAGRDFTDSPADRQYVIVNEEAAKQLGLGSEEAVGKQIDLMGKREIIGVVSSFHEAGLHEELMPSMYIIGAGFTKFLTVSMSGGIDQEKIALIERTWKSYFPDKPFQYFFLDEFFNRQYATDQMAGNSIALFAGFAILIACLGLFALSVFTVHRKAKEISIKKVLGASVGRIVNELCVLFVGPICMSALIGIPVSYYLVNKWLEQYAYATELDVKLFALPVIVLVIIGISTVAYQSVQAARRNPVESLKSE